jgi:hypothetical protein
MEKLKYSSTHSYPWHKIEANGQLQASAALPREKEPPVPSGWDAGGPRSIVEAPEKINCCSRRESHPDSSHRPLTELSRLLK